VRLTVPLGRIPMGTEGVVLKVAIQVTVPCALVRFDNDRHLSWVPLTERDTLLVVDAATTSEAQMVLPL
jgi:hypothetical protein